MKAETEGFTMEGKSPVSTVLMLQIALALLPAQNSFAQSCDSASQTLEQARACYKQEGEREKALRRALSLLPAKPEKIQEINSYLSSVDPFSVPVRELLLSLYIEQQQWDPAFEEFRVIRRLDSEHYSKEKVAEVLVSTRRFADALKNLDSMIQKEPGNLQTRKLRAVARYETGDYHGTLEDLRHFIGSSENTHALDLARAKTLQKLGRANESKAIVVELDWLALQSPAQISEFGILAEKLGELELAEDSFQHAYQASPGEGGALMLARVLQARKKHTKAEEMLVAALGSWASSDLLMAALLDHYVSRGKIAKAGANLEAWRKKFPDRAWLKNEWEKMRASIGGKAARPPSTPVTEKELSERKKPAKRVKTTKANTTRVRPGESLMSISNRLFGTHQRWKEIWKLNRKELRSPSSVRARMMLKVPPVSVAEEEEAQR